MFTWITSHLLKCSFSSRNFLLFFFSGWPVSSWAMCTILILWISRNLPRKDRIERCEQPMNLLKVLCQPSAMLVVWCLTLCSDSPPQGALDITTDIGSSRQTAAIFGRALDHQSLLETWPGSHSRRLLPWNPEWMPKTHSGLWTFHCSFISLPYWTLISATWTSVCLFLCFCL